MDKHYELLSGVTFFHWYFQHPSEPNSRTIVESLSIPVEAMEQDS